MSVPRHASNKLHNLDYNKIIILTVLFLPTTFNGEIMFEVPPLFPSNPSLMQMQGIDRKYDGHAWLKVITTNIKNSFGLNFKKVHCLGDLCYVKTNCDCLIHFRVWIETTWVKELAQVPSKGQVIKPPSSSFACKFYNFPPSCVDPCKCQIYYVVHKLQSILRAIIHLGVHLHPITNGRCRKVVDENKKLIEEEVNQTHDAKISTIFLCTSKSFLANIYSMTTMTKIVKFSRAISSKKFKKNSLC